MFIVVYVTHDNLESAKKMATHLLNLRLIACVNYLPIAAAYWWNGEIATGEESVTLLKTSEKNWDKLKAEIEKIHPYNTPCIIKFNVEANQEYEEWIEKESSVEKI